MRLQPIDYELTPEQIEYFDTQGFLVLRNWIPQSLLENLQQASDTAINHALKLYEQKGQSEEGTAITVKNANPFVVRINQLFRDRDPVFLELLGSPQILSLARSLAGEDPVSTYESILIKNADDGAEIGWHRDMGHLRKNRVITVGVYLDEAREGEGALRVIPGSQLSSDELCSIEEGWKRGALKAVEVDMNPGDVLVHDVMTVHGSKPFTGRGRRRTIYFEFRSKEHAASNELFTSEWVNLRHELRTIAEARWGQKENPLSGGTPHEWTEVETDFIRRLYAVQTRIEVGHYCFPTG